MYSCCNYIIESPSAFNIDYMYIVWCSFIIVINLPCFFVVGMTLGELRQLYFRMREEVFVGGMFSVSKKTDALEALLQQQFGDKCMNDVEFPK